MKFLKGLLKILLVSFIITAVFFPVAVLIHEGTHYVMYTLEGIEVTSFHVLDSDSFENGNVGYITPLKNSTYGLLFQEMIAYFFQCLFLGSTLLFFLVKPLKVFTVHQLELMIVRRGAHYNSRYDY